MIFCADETCDVGNELDWEIGKENGYIELGRSQMLNGRLMASGNLTPTLPR